LRRKSRSSQNVDGGRKWKSKLSILHSVKRLPNTLQQSNMDCYTLGAETFMSHRFEIAQKIEALGKKVLLIALIFVQYS